jgi:hypothetical protein
MMNILNRRIQVLALALAAGVTYAVFVAWIAIYSVISNTESLMLASLSQVYPNYAASCVGALWGALWAFISTFIGLFLFGLLYNLFAGEK